MTKLVPSRSAMTLTGVSGGLLSGVVGGGGGAIMVPLMTGVLKLRQHVAHGTSLVVITFAALASAITYTIGESIDWTLVVILVAASMAGAFLGASGAQHLPALRLRQALGGFLLLVAVRLMFFQDLDALFDVSGASEALAGGAIGLAGGLLSGALGVGGGAIFVPALVILLGTPQHEAQGISLWVVVCAAATGAVTHYRLGTVDARSARWIAPVAVPAGVAGSLIAHWLDTGQLQTVFAVILTAIGLQMVVTATRRLRRPAATAPAAGEAAA
jgi:hypothetical protein